MKKNKEILQQFIKFGLVGFSNTLIHTICFNIALALGANDFVAQTIGFLIASINGFLLNKNLVFKQANNNKKMIVKYYVTYIFSYCLTLALTYLYVEVMHIDSTIVLFGYGVNYLPLLTLVVTVPINFILSRYWVYK